MRTYVVILFFLFLCKFLPAQNDTLYILYPFQFGGYSLNEFDTYFNKDSLRFLNVQLQKKSKELLVSELKVRESTSDLYSKLERGVDRNGRKQILFIPFLLSDFGYITCWVFAIDANKKTMLLEETFHANRMDSKSIVSELIKSLDKKNLYKNPVSPSSNFYDLTMPGRIEFCYHEFKNWKFENEQVETTFDDKHRYSVDEVFDAIEKYYLDGNADLIKFMINKEGKVKDNPSPAGKSLKKIGTDYNRLWVVVKAIKDFEYYREDPKSRPPAVLKNIMRKINEIQLDADELSEEENEKYDLYNFEKLAANLTKSVQMAYNCDEIKRRAEALDEQGKHLDATSIYLDILRTPNIYSIAKALKNKDENTMECSAFKDDAYAWCNNYLYEKNKQYQEIIKSAHKKENEKKISEAKTLVSKAHKIDNNLSYYMIVDKINPEPIKKVSKDSLRINPEEITISIRDGISREFGSIFNPGLLGQQLKDTIINETIEIHFAPGDTEWRAWFSEWKYRVGKYTSPNDDLISEKVSTVLSETYRKYGDYIDTIFINLIGSADNIPFASNSKVKVYNLSYESIADQVCFCKEPTDKFVACYDFQFLRNGKGGIQNLPNGNEVVLTPSKSKNLALAYMRAYHRKVSILQLLKGHIPDNVISTSLCGILHEFPGEEYRYVEMKVLIKTRKYKKPK